MGYGQATSVHVCVYVHMCIYMYTLRLRSPHQEMVSPDPHSVFWNTTMWFKETSRIFHTVFADQRKFKTACFHKSEKSSYIFFPGLTPDLLIINVKPGCWKNTHPKKMTNANVFDQRIFCPLFSLWNTEITKYFNYKKQNYPNLIHMIRNEHFASRLDETYQWSKYWCNFYWCNFVL